MATGDLNYLQAMAAELLSVPAFSNLPPNVQQEVTAFINEAYHECFLRPNGKRARWASQVFSFILKAPQEMTLSLTNGSAQIGSASPALNPAFAGSRLMIGVTPLGGTQTQFYTYAGQDANENDWLVEPWDQPSGSYVFTFYSSSYILPLSSLDVLEEPEILGYGRLSPISGPAQEIRNREWTTGDVIPERGAVWWNWIPALPDAGFETGDPIWYYVDDTQLAPGGVLGSMVQRFCVYPLPDNSTGPGSGPDRTVRIRASILPALLVNGSDMPFMKASAVISTLLPLARMKIANGSRRYAGNNLKQLNDEGEKAELKLESLDPSQQKRPARIKVRDGF